MIGQDWGLVLAVLGWLMAFGILYNALVAWADRNGYTEGFLSLIVAFGVTVTLLGAAILDWRAALIVFLCFVASGTPMIIGSFWRYIRRREAAKRVLLEEIYDPTARMAE